MGKLPSKREIRERAEGLDIMGAMTHGLPTITPERYELQESGLLKEAQRDLMTSEEKKYRGQAEQYVRTMAEEVDLYVLSPGEHREYKKKMKLTLRPGHIWTGKKWVKFKGTVDMERVSGTEKVKVSIISPKGVRKHVKTVRIPRKKQPKRAPVVSPADIVLGKKAGAPKKRRKRIRTERAGKTMKALRKVNGVNVFSFPDHVWKVKPARKRKK